MTKGEIHLWNFPFLVRQPQPASLFDALQPGTPCFWAWRLGRRLFGLHCSFAGIDEFSSPFILRTVNLKSHSGSIFACVNCGNTLDRHRQVAGNTTKTGLEIDKIVSNQQFFGRIRPQIKHNLAIANKLARYAGTFIDLDRYVRSETVVTAPLPDGAEQVGLGRRKFHAYLRIAFSDGVSASMKP